MRDHMPRHSESETMRDLVNADFSRRVVIGTGELPWIPSPQAGVQRRLLDRIGGEVARATSLVRYAPACAFPAHRHELGEEFLVLDGLFSDEYGDYPAGTYVRNPPGSCHAPRTGPGCIIFVKLRQMPHEETERIALDTTSATWERVAAEGQCRRQLLYRSGTTGEIVTLEQLALGARLAPDTISGGEEIYVLTGNLRDDHGRYGAGTWIRNPVGFRRSLPSEDGATFWVKRGHLRTTP
jgi:anti-sigma factor ChrR (cupin superfamily)